MFVKYWLHRSLSPLSCTNCTCVSKHSDFSARDKTSRAQPSFFLLLLWKSCTMGYGDIFRKFFHRQFEISLGKVEQYCVTVKTRIHGGNYWLCSHVWCTIVPRFSLADWLCLMNNIQNLPSIRQAIIACATKMARTRVYNLFFSLVNIVFVN